MRTTQGVTKVVNFGLARSQLVETHSTQQGMLVGTPAYMAPELWMGQEADAQSDLYALVLSYYHVLTGQLPFCADQFVQVGHLHTCTNGLPMRRLVGYKCKKPSSRNPTARLGQGGAGRSVFECGGNSPRTSRPC